MGADHLEEYTPGGIIKVSYVHGLDLISQNRDGEGKFFYHVDGLGSTRALSNALGIVTDSYIYDAFGRTIGQVGDTGNVYLFAGEARDSVIGLVYLRARYLDVGTGRFVSRDSFEGFIQQPNSLHHYLYANANSVNLIDPSGEFSIASLSAAVSANSILSSLALTHFLFAGLAFEVIIKAIGPGIEGRYTALLAIASTTDGKVLNEAFDLYRRSNDIIAIGTQLIQATSSAIGFANAIVGLGGTAGNLAKASGNAQKFFTAVSLIEAAADVALKIKGDEDDPSPVEQGIKKFRGFLLSVLGS